MKLGLCGFSVSLAHLVGPAFCFKSIKPHFGMLITFVGSNKNARENGERERDKTKLIPDSL